MRSACGRWATCPRSRGLGRIVQQAEVLIAGGDFPQARAAVKGAILTASPEEGPVGEGAIRQAETPAVRLVLAGQELVGPDAGPEEARIVGGNALDLRTIDLDQIVTQEAARSLAAGSGIHLEGLGGTHGGVIGESSAAWIAVGLK